MTIILFEDNQCHNLRPIGLFRPLWNLISGSVTLLDMVKTLGVPVYTLRRNILLENENKPDTLPNGNGPILFINASVEPDLRYLDTIRKLMAVGDPFLTTSGNRIAAALVTPDKHISPNLSSDTISPFLLELGLPLEHEMFKTIDWPHHAVESHLRLFGTNLERILSAGNYTENIPGLFVKENVTLAPTVVVDTKKGPVVIENGVTVMHFTYLEGPIHIGADTRIIEHSSIKDNTSIGYGAKIGGEVESTVIEQRSNKQHHGFLGHSWVGRWVNLGAGTSTSDLKNTYGKVRVYYQGKRYETGMLFLGSIIGDFVKSAVNTSLFTGKIVGASSMLYGTVSTNVPCFTNYARSFGQVTELTLDQALITQKRMFARRNVQQTQLDINIMRKVFELTRDERVMSNEAITF